MTEDEKKTIESKKVGKPKTRTPGSGGKLSLLISLAALSVSAYIGFELLYRQQGLLTGDLPQTVRHLTSTVDVLKQNDTSNRTDIDQLREKQETLTETLRKTSLHLSESRVSWVIAESEQLMIIANQRLQLAGDMDTAAIALEIADQRLRDLADPDLTPVRKILAKEIQSLKSTERADIAGIALRLSALADSVGSLPLSLEFQQLTKLQEEKRTEKQAKQGPAQGAKRNKNKGFFVEFWGDIMSVISIRTNVESYKPLLPPEQQYFLRENLRLMILGAQQAALRADPDTYRNNLKSANRWAQEYFDTRSQPLLQLIREIGSLSKARLATAQPNISASLKELRKISLKKAGL
ncbi:MAG: uroporphyrinogen-III C-methyltransferase [Acidiferrobacterales bacterium]